MSKKYYVRGEVIDLDYWAISLDNTPEHDLNAIAVSDLEYVSDKHGKILGVAWEMEL
jgi:hypothetical protein|tara:strand:+ start:291 stop:461 length:171 start_codon:yes stop_codon:yes gene_type:complete